MATQFLTDQPGFGARPQLPAPPSYPLGAVPPPATGAVIGRRPTINMGMADVVPPAQLPPVQPAGAVPAPAAPMAPAQTAAAPGPGGEVIGRRPTINMGAADVVQPARVTTAAAPTALAAPEAVARFPVAGAVRAGGAALGVGLEGKQVYDVASNPNSTGLDVAAQAAQGVGRLGAAGAGAAGGAAAGSVLGPVGAAVGGIIGGGVGYMAADKAIAGGRALAGSDPRSPADQLAAAAPAAPAAAAAAPTTSGGAVFGIYPRPSSQFSTNANDAALQRGVQATGPSTFVPAAPAVPGPTAPGQRFTNLTDPRSLEFQGGVNAAPPSAPPGGAAPPVSPPGFGALPAPTAGDPNLPLGVTRNGSAYSDGSQSSGVGIVGAIGVTSADRIAQMNRDIAFEKDKQTWRNPSDPTPGLAVFDTAIDPNRNAMFNAEANVNTLRSRGAPPGRNGAQVFDQQMKSALTPIQQRVEAAALATREAGDTQRSLIQERGTEARARLTDARQQEANSIDRAKLGLEAVKVGQGNVSPGYKVNPDGSWTPITGSPADPNTPKGKNALTDTQAKALQFGSRMQASEGILSTMAAAGVNQPGLIKRGADAVGLGGAANWTQSPQQQQVEQAQRDFINAALRRESGAAIADSEFSNARLQYFPQPGDSAQVIAQKKQNRDLATRGILAEVPDGDKRLTQVRGADAATAPKAGTVEAGYAFIGGDPADQRNWRKQ